MRARLQPAIDYLVYFLVRVFICVIQAVRIETCEACAKNLAYLLNDVLRIRRKVVDDNLHQTFPHLTGHQRRVLARQMWNHLLLMVCEIAHVPRKIHETNWRDYIHIHRNRELTGYLLDPRPKVVVSGHFGNFEVASYMCGLLGFQTFAIARTLDNLHLNRFVNRFRGANGQYILPKDGSAKTVEAILSVGGTISLLGDQHAGRRGCWVDFLGRPASCHKALALFTLTSKAPMVVSYARRLNKPLHFEIGLQGVADPALPDEHQESVASLTQWYNQRLAEMIVRHPSQYWWLHRRWKGEPPKRKKRKKASPEDDRKVA